MGFSLENMGIRQQLEMPMLMVLTTMVCPLMRGLEFKSYIQNK